MAKQDDYTRYTIRVPGDLYEQIAAGADASGRSINAEITARLESTLGHPYAPLIRTLIDLQEDLLDNQFELELDPDTLGKLSDLARLRGWTIEKLVSKLVTGALFHLDEQTPLGKELDAHLKETLGKKRDNSDVL